LASLGHPCKFQRLSRLGSVTTRHSSPGRQPNFAALNRERHLYSAHGRATITLGIDPHSSYYYNYVGPEMPKDSSQILYSLHFKECVLLGSTVADSRCCHFVGRLSLCFELDDSDVSTTTSDVLCTCWFVRRHNLLTRRQTCKT